MSELSFGTASSDAQLRQILALQRRNLETNLPREEVDDQGFVTVQHDLALLRDMNAEEAHVIATSEDRVVGYALVMSRRFEDRISILKPMYAVLDQLSYRGKAVNDYRYFIMGQVCVDKPFRGSGAFAGMYREMQRVYATKYDMILTEVARRNVRSIRAHEKVGFELLHSYRDKHGEHWDLIVLDWQDVPPSVT